MKDNKINKNKINKNNKIIKNEMERLFNAKYENLQHI